MAENNWKGCQQHSACAGENGARCRRAAQEEHKYCQALCSCIKAAAFQGTSKNQGADGSGQTGKTQSGSKMRVKAASLRETEALHAFVTAMEKVLHGSPCSEYVLLRIFK